MTGFPGVTFGKLRIPLHSFMENYEDGGWGVQDLVVNYTVDPKELRFDAEKNEWLYNPEGSSWLPKDVLDCLKATVEKKKKDAELTGKMFFDGQQVRLYNFSALGEEERPVIHVSPVSFFTYAATNKALNDKILKDVNDNPTSIKEKYNVDVHYPNDVLANPIGVSSAIISEPDQALVMVQRSSKLAVYPDLYGVAAAGFMDPLRDRIAGAPNPFKTIQREIKEEAGIPCDTKDFKLFVVGRACDDLHGELFGEYKTNLKVNEILSTQKKSKYESLRMFSVPFNPETVIGGYKDANYPGMVGYRDFEFNGTNPGPWVPAHAVATVYSLIKTYGRDAVLKAANDL